jgi:hypothetical protein
MQTWRFLQSITPSAYGRGSVSTAALARRILTVGREPLSESAAKVNHQRGELQRHARIAQRGQVRLDEQQGRRIVASIPIERAKHHVQPGLEYVGLLEDHVDRLQ